MLQSAPKQGENTWLWLVKMVTGPLLICFGLLHVIVNHLVYEGGLMQYSDVVAYLSRPAIALIEASFLVLVVTHSLLGLRSVILDLNLSRNWQRSLDWILTILGVVAVAYGLWLTALIGARGAG